MTAVKTWNGSAWIDSTTPEKVWNGSTWISLSSGGGPTTEAITWPTGPSLTNGDDTDTYNMGLEFHVTADGSWTGVEWNPNPTNSTSPAGGQHYAQAWNISGTLLTPSKAFTPTFAGEKQQVLFDTPVSITTGNSYVTSIYTRSYCFLSNATWDETSPSGKIHADSGHLRVDNSGEALFPSSSFNAIYFISPIVEFS